MQVSCRSEQTCRTSCFSIGRMLRHDGRPNPPPGRGYLRNVWRSLEAYLHNTGPARPAPLWGEGGRVRSALQEFFSDLPTTQQSSESAARGKATFADGTEVGAPLFEKKFPEQHLFDAIEYFQKAENYTMELSQVGDRVSLSRIAEIIYAPCEGAVL